MKQEFNTNRPNSVSTKFEFNNNRDYAIFTDRRNKEESLARRSARSRAATRPRNLSRRATKDLYVNRNTRSRREKERNNQDILGDLKTIHN